MVTVRAGVQVSPSYFGSKDYEVGPDLAARVDFLRLPGGFDYGSSRTVGFRQGWGLQGSFRYIGDRDGKDELEGLDDVPWSAEVGLGVGYEQRNWRAFTDVRYGVVGHNSWVGELGADAIAYPLEGLTLTAGPRLSFGSDSFARTYFGISNQESAANGPRRPTTPTAACSAPASRSARATSSTSAGASRAPPTGSGWSTPPPIRRSPSRARRPVQPPHRHHPPDQPRFLSRLPASARRRGASSPPPPSAAGAASRAAAAQAGYAAFAQRPLARQRAVLVGDPEQIRDQPHQPALVGVDPVGAATRHSASTTPVRSS